MPEGLLQKMKKNLLITGGAGFVGSNLAVFLNEKLKDYHIVCFDNLIRRGSQLNAARLEDHGIDFIKGDVRYKEQLLSLKDIHVILDCAAEPSVLASHTDPVYTIDTNLIGTLHCLELARRDKSHVIFLSSSRVYPIEPVNRILFEELPTRFDWKKKIQGPGHSYEGIANEFPLSGVRSLYGASKLSSEQMCLEYIDLFNFNGVINRLGIIAGPWQMGKVDQGIVGFWVAAHKFNNGLSYIGYDGCGKQLRDAIHVDDVCELVLYQIENMGKVNGKVYNVGGGRKNSFSLLELTDMVQRITGKKMVIEKVKQERKNDMRIYITDNAWVTNDMGWSPRRNLEEIITDINIWIDQHFGDLESVMQVELLGSIDEEKVEKMRE